jgi:16S rRNA C967 or C1407 C5-methylase (RsmB/RsmF family)/NOL1/NOP2/fmu family ribosome biogenesis protein
MNNIENVNLPKRFEAMMRQRLGESGFAGFEESLQQKPPVSIRVNPHKGHSLFKDEEKVPWCSFGKYLKERPAFVWDPLYHAGAYYAQEASSMLFANAIDFSKDLRVLDLCAAPGGKSSLLLSYMTENSLLVSNELVGKRASILYENLVKWGCANNIITNNRASDFGAFKGYFDVVMIDAPCSGEGMFRKDREAVEQWSEGLVAQCSIVQKDILTNAVELVAPGGLLIYSTCTFENAENEANLQWLYKNYGQRLEPAIIPVQKNWNIQEIDVKVDGNRTQKGYYCFPHLLKGEGQFVSAIRISDHNVSRHLAKGLGRTIKHLTRNEIPLLAPYARLNEGHAALKMGEDILFAVPESIVGDVSQFVDRMRIKKTGTMLGRLMRQSFVPDHELVMDGLDSDEMPHVPLNLDEALDFMGRKNLELQPGTPKGWIVLTYEGTGIGLAKNLGNRINNHYPAEWRIRKERK